MKIFLLLGDFNIDIDEKKVTEFLKPILKNLVKQNTCYENPKNPSCNDLILPNRPRIFQNTDAVKRRLSYFYKLIIVVLKKCIPKQKPKITGYGDYQNFCIVAFRVDIDKKLLDYETYLF